MVKLPYEKLGKSGPDLVVCTHYDSDHIAGLIDLIGHFGADIGEVWVHEPPASLIEGFTLTKTLLTKKVIPLDYCQKMFVP